MTWRDDRVAERRTLLRAMVQHRVPVAESLRDLRDHEWDHDELVGLDVTHVSAVLRRVIRGEVSAAEATAWADAVEVRDDIGRTVGQEATINDVLLEMSSPELFEDLAVAAPRLLARLQAETS